MSELWRKTVTDPKLRITTTFVRFMPAMPGAWPVFPQGYHIHLVIEANETEAADIAKEVDFRKARLKPEAYI